MARDGKEPWPVPRRRGTESSDVDLATYPTGATNGFQTSDDLMLDRQVALKFLASPTESDAQDQLLTEARAAAALDHPFICSTYEVSSLNDRPCIAMEYVRGETLERRLRRVPYR